MRKLLLVLMMLGMNSVYASGADMNSPVGDWKAVDDKSGQLYGVIQIKELPDHTLAGTLIKIYPKAV